jgi:hypothetical protein
MSMRAVVTGWECCVSVFADAIGIRYQPVFRLEADDWNRGWVRCSSPPPARHGGVIVLISRDELPFTALQEGKGRRNAVGRGGSDPEDVLDVINTPDGQERIHQPSPFPARCRVRLTSMSLRHEERAKRPVFCKLPKLLVI